MTGCHRRVRERREVPPWSPAPNAPRGRSRLLPAAAVRGAVQSGVERGAGPAPAPLGGRVPKGSALLSWSPGGSSPASTALSEDMIECGRFPGVLPAPCFLPVLSLIKQNREGSEGGLRHKGARFGDRVRGHFLAIRSLRGRIAQAKRNSL